MTGRGVTTRSAKSTRGGRGRGGRGSRAGRGGTVRRGSASRPSSTPGSLARRSHQENEDFYREDSTDSLIICGSKQIGEDDSDYVESDDDAPIKAQPESPLAQHSIGALLHAATLVTGVINTQGSDVGSDVSGRLREPQGQQSALSDLGDFQFPNCDHLAIPPTPTNHTSNLRTKMTPPDLDGAVATAAAALQMIGDDYSRRDPEGYLASTQAPRLNLPFSASGPNSYQESNRESNRGSNLDSPSHTRQNSGLLGRLPAWHEVPDAGLQAAMSSGLTSGFLAMPSSSRPTDPVASVDQNMPPAPEPELDPEAMDEDEAGPEISVAAGKQPAAPVLVLTPSPLAYQRPIAPMRRTAGAAAAKASSASAMPAPARPDVVRPDGQSPPPTPSSSKRGRLSPLPAGSAHGAVTPTSASGSATRPRPAASVTSQSPSQAPAQAQAVTAEAVTTPTVENPPPTPSQSTRPKPPVFPLARPTLRLTAPTAPSMLPQPQMQPQSATPQSAQSTRQSQPMAWTSQTQYQTTGDAGPSAAPAQPGPSTAVANGPQPRQSLAMHAKQLTVLQAQALQLEAERARQLRIQQMTMQQSQNLARQRIQSAQRPAQPVGATQPAQAAPAPAQAAPAPAQAAPAPAQANRTAQAGGNQPAQAAQPAAGPAPVQAAYRFAAPHQESGDCTGLSSVRGNSLLVQYPAMDSNVVQFFFDLPCGHAPGVRTTVAHIDHDATINMARRTAARVAAARPDSIRISRPLLAQVSIYASLMFGEEKLLETLVADTRFGRWVTTKFHLTQPGQGQDVIRIKPMAPLYLIRMAITRPAQGLTEEDYRAMYYSFRILDRIRCILSFAGPVAGAFTVGRDRIEAIYLLKFLTSLLRLLLNLHMDSERPIRHPVVVAEIRADASWETANGPQVIDYYSKKPCQAAALTIPYQRVTEMVTFLDAYRHRVWNSTETK